MTFDFKDKNVLITGGTRGIGLAASRLFALSGANVFMTYRKNRIAAEAALKELAPGKHSIFALDVTKAPAVRDFLRPIRLNIEP